MERISFDELAEALTKEVNSLMREGWKPQGGVSIIQVRTGFYKAYQAMIK